MTTELPNPLSLPEPVRIAGTGAGNGGSKLAVRDAPTMDVCGDRFPTAHPSCWMQNGDALIIRYKGDIGKRKDHDSDLNDRSALQATQKIEGNNLQPY